jgi:hypothetical protein
MPQYALLIYEIGDPDWSALDTPEKKEAMAGYGEFGATAAAVIRGAPPSIPPRPRRPSSATGARRGKW